MLLRFIGQDGSMGLKRHKVYDVRVRSDARHIWVHVCRLFEYDITCPYDTPQAFAKNWSGCQ